MHTKLIPDIQKAKLDKVNYYTFLALAFSLNFSPSVTKFTLALWTLSSIFCVGFDLSKPIRKKYFIPILLLMLLIVGRIIISVIHGDTLSLFQKLADTHLTLVVLPIILAFVRIKFFNLKVVLKTYVYGCLASCIFLVLYFYLYRFNILKESAELFFPKTYKPFSLSDDILIFQNFTTYFFKHRAALAININMALACIIYLAKKTDNMSITHKVTSISTALFISFVLYATGSRSGYLSFVIVLILGLFYLFSHKKIILSVAFFSIFGLIAGLSSLKTTRPLLFKEILSSDYSKLRDGDPRFKIWESCVEIIKKHPVIGIGYKEVRPSLFKSYKENGLMVDLQAKNNSHNQFFQFAMESGIWASIVFGLILLPVYYKRNLLFISVAFSSIMIIYSLFEDSLITINGVSFFVFFISLLVLSQRRVIMLHR